MSHTARSSNPSRLLSACAVAATLLLSGCEYLGVETPAKTAENKVAEGKAIGGACRHANRALEDCYRYNPKANKAAVFDGWKDMDVYMRENKLDAIAPVTPPEPAKKPPPSPKADEEADAEEDSDKKPAGSKPADKKSGD